MTSTVQAGFEKRSVFDALKAHDVMCHGRIYALLSRILDGLDRPFRLLDVGCADASNIAHLLAKHRISAYVGVDSSSEALDQALVNLAALPCPVRLIHGDYQQALTAPPASFDIVWMGLFLHHLDHAQKKDFLARASSLLSSHGLLLAHDPLLGEHEDRAAYIERLEKHGQKHWAFLSPEQLAMAGRHWSKHGRQERYSTLLGLGLQAGYQDVTLLWSDPDQFYGLICFQKADTAKTLLLTR